jgi:SAM-dependent methyltransferase
LSADYAVLAPIYLATGMADFSEAMTPRLIDFAQRHDWMGRRILDLGCGPGASLEWLTRRNYITIGVDQSAAMLELCRQRLEASGLYHDLREQDARDLSDDLGAMDLVLALDVVNELNSLRDLEALFNSVHRVLNEKRLFIFDLHTIQGLTGAGSTGNQIIRDSASLTVIASNGYDFDRQVHERRYLIFHHENGSWQRAEAMRVLRGYPVQAVAALLQRCGFHIQHVVTPAFDDFDPGISRADRILLLAEKQ